MSKLPSCMDYEVAINEPRLIKCSKLRNGQVEKNAMGTTINYVGGFCIVFPFYKSNGEKIAVRCWIANVDNAQDRTRKIAEGLKRINLPYFVNFEYEPEGLATNSGVQPIVLMDWIAADSLKDYIGKNIQNSDKLKQLAESFKKMVADLHNGHISHGDLQHGNILVRDDGSLVLVDYDSMYVPGLQRYKDDIKGLAGYQHPARWDNDFMTEKADYFSELIIYTSIMTLSYYPVLWNELNMKDTETLLFSAEDIKSKGSSDIFKKLDTHPELKNLSEAIRKALKCNSLEELKPLESATTSTDGQIGNGIRIKWNDPPKNIFIPDTADTRSKWNKL